MKLCTPTKKQETSSYSIIEALRPGDAFTFIKYPTQVWMRTFTGAIELTGGGSVAEVSDSNPGTWNSCGAVELHPRACICLEGCEK